MYDAVSRERKAKTIVAVLEDHIRQPLYGLSLLNVGGSAGIIDNSLADHFHSVVSIDIDEQAIKHAKSNFQKKNINFQLGDAINLAFSDNSFDVLICSHVYEHVTSPEKMTDEIFRVLVPGGICYFAASNRLMWNEPHYNLPLLSVIPRPLAHLYLKSVKGVEHYHELHYTYWGLKKLVRRFSMYDYTSKMISNPIRYHIDYLVTPRSVKAKIARFVTRKLPWISPGYIWLLEKPS
jgi:2-polyprenyl-3-methyl-5-hydroxy-6-metoxy-1,4-benzoquinol methylase